MTLARLWDVLGPVLLLLGLAGYAVLVGLGWFADWYLPYPATYVWAWPLLLSGFRLAIMYLRAPAHRVSFADGEEE